MRNILLFQGECAACSRVASMVDRIGVSGLETLSIESAEAAHLLAMAGLERLERPSVLIVDGDQVEVKDGWAMRMRLARLIGMRRGTALVSLSMAEWRARGSRELMPSSTGRRGFLGGAAAVVAGLVLIPGKAYASGRNVPAQGSLGTPSAGSVQRALASQPVETAVRTWGAVSTDVQEVAAGGERVLVFRHSGSNVVTFVDNSAGASQAEPTAVSMGKTADGSSLRFYTVQGTPLGDLTPSGTGVEVTPPETDASPNITWRGAWRFIVCLGHHVDPTCVIACLGCDPADPFALASCAQCVFCSGPKAIECARAYLHF